ncbi:type VI secretion system contractile sheath small subunit [Niveispirillum irakense]|uniref:type VI secretion system contractile sheath small subunit n=1 Tax=Niveispirillum irakense TaxID=34011 RepID=UPI00041A4E1C|nr:type VI secretion system contractile sheath small subunit [Niveispirillum irakense]
MSDVSVAPRERINIKYTTETNGQKAEQELPLLLVPVGCFTPRQEGEVRDIPEMVEINPDTFDAVMESQNIELSLSVPDALRGDGSNHDVTLNIQKLEDFTPDRLVAQLSPQIEPLRKLLELRAALGALRGPLANKESFRKVIQGIVNDPDLCDRILSEMDM